jgi:hypothetical protein
MEKEVHNPDMTTGIPEYGIVMSGGGAGRKDARAFG